MRSSSTRQEIDGREALRIELDQPARRVDMVLERLFRDDTADGNFAEAGRVQFFLGGVFAGEHVFTGNAANGQRALSLDFGHDFDRLVFTSGAYDAAGIFRHGAGVDAAGQARLPTATASATGTGSDYLLGELEFFFDEQPIIQLAGVSDLPAS